MFKLVQGAGQKVGLELVFTMLTVHLNFVQLLKAVSIGAIVDHGLATYIQ